MQLAVQYKTGAETMKLKLVATAFASFLAAAFVQPAAAAETYSSSYSVSVLGLKVATTSFKTVISDDGFSIEGRLKSAGLASFFDDTVGSTKVVAKHGGGTVEPVSYELSYQSGKKRQRTAIAFAGGNAVSTENNPPLRKFKSYVPLRDGDLRQVFDPISSAMIPAKGPEGVCNRTVRIYDGEMRVDMKLTYRGTVPVSATGYKGNGIRCSVKYVPVSGYRPNQKQVVYLRDQAVIETVFAPVADTGFWAPIRAAVSTKIGTVTVFAKTFALAN